MAIRKSSISGTPKGATADRPANPSVGDTFNNGTLGVEEIYTASGWVAKSAPGATPTNVVATNQGSGRAFNNGQASISFSAGTGGGLVSDYIVIPSPATSPTTFTGSSSPITVTGLQSSTQYTYTVQGRNNFGTSISSAASAAVTATTVPQAPTIGTATAGESQATVTFTSGATGGSAITSYTVTSSPGNITASGASSPITVAGLMNDGTSYTFTVTATNANGTSAASAATNSVTPTAILSIDYLVVAGGGAGGTDDLAGAGSGGGGAGGLRCTVGATGGGGSLESALQVSTLTSYNVTVGAGGAAAYNTFPGNASDSTFSTITSTRGGYGAGRWAVNGNVDYRDAQSGGSGGGGNGYTRTTGASGTDNQGYSGGTGNGLAQYAGSGGGGAGSPGNGHIGSTAGAGGNGVTTSISGSSITYAGGGGGAGSNAGSAGAAGGSGGGGAGGTGGTTAGAGTANTGGGGGGGANATNGRGGNGGSGIVILRYPSSRTISVGAGLTASTSTIGDNKVTTFTAGTGTISFS
jgi:hypothetical protein